MALSKECRYVVLQSAHVGVVAGLDIDLAQVVLPEELLHGGGVGDDQHIIGVEPALVALGLEDADNAEVDVLDADTFAEGVLLGEEQFRRGGPYDGNACGVVLLDSGKRAALVQFEVADVQVGKGGAADGGVGVLAEVLDLRPARDKRCDGLNAVEFVEDGLCIGEFE